MTRTIRVASGQGFWGDQLEAPKQQIAGGQIDYLMLDYLAEVTMSILQKQRSRDPTAGYAKDFVALMAETLPTLIDRGIRVVANAGGVNSRGCAAAVRAAAGERGIETTGLIGVVTGDDITERLADLVAAGIPLGNMETGVPLEEILPRVQSASAYLGARPIVEALDRGARIVVTGRCMDTALTYGPLIHEFGWQWGDYDRIAAGIVAGHLNECGAQASGGNSLVDWETIPDLQTVGYPIVEVDEDGSFFITKHPGTGGRITKAIVTEQLVYELGDPARYMSPDAIADFTSIQLTDIGADRVRVSGARGGAPSSELKVSIAYSAGYKAIGTLVYGWPDAIAKARAADRILRSRLERLGLIFDEMLTEYVGWNATHGPLAGDAPDIPEVMARWAVRSDDRGAVERFTREIAPLVLSGPPTVTGYGGGRPRVQEIVAYWPALVPRNAVEPFVEVDIL